MLYLRLNTCPASADNSMLACQPLPFWQRSCREIRPRTSLTITRRLRMNFTGIWLTNRQKQVGFAAIVSVKT